MDRPVSPADSKRRDVQVNRPSHTWRRLSRRRRRYFRAPTCFSRIPISETVDREAGLRRARRLIGGKSRWPIDPGARERPDAWPVYFGRAQPLRCLPIQPRLPPKDNAPTDFGTAHWFRGLVGWLRKRCDSCAEERVLSRSMYPSSDNPFVTRRRNPTH